MWTKLKSYFQNKQLKALQSNHNGVKTLLNWNKVKSCAVFAILSNEQDLVELNKIETYLKKQNISVFSSCFVSKPKAAWAEPLGKSKKLITSEDFNWLGVLKNQKIAEIQAQKVDVLFDLSYSPNRKHQISVLAHQSSLIVGCDKHELQANYDFMIQQNQKANKLQLVEQAIFYLRKINNTATV